MSEFKPEEIVQSVVHVGDVYRYTKGERALPLQQEDLVAGYLNSIKKYFEFCNQALTDPSILELIARGRVGMNDRVGHFNTLLGQTEGVRGIARDVNLIIDKVTPRLVFTQEAYWMSNAEEEKFGWTEEVVNKYQSAEGYVDWVFAQTQTDGDGRQACLYGFRTMGASDLFYPDMMPRFVKGVSRAFWELKDQATSEASQTFNGLRDVGRIGEITKAFGEANNILEKAFNPDATAKQVPQRRGSTQTP